MRHKKNQAWAGAGIIAAIAASVCCITPVLALVAGLSGAASSLSWLEPLRPIFIVLTIAVLGFAWYQQLRKRKEIDCDCEEQPSFWQGKKFLAIVTVLALLLLAFPYYANSLLPSSQANVINSEIKDIQKVDLQIEGMTCVGCEATINQAVLQVAGVLQVESDHKSGQATVEIDGSKASIDDLTAAIQDAGYRVKSILGNQQ